jgi:hypothetical protein
MNPQISNTQGVSQAVQEAIARRGQGQPSQQAPAMTSQAPAMTQTSTPSMGATSQPAIQGSSSQPAQKFVPKDSHELLVSTLAESLKNEYKLKEEQNKFGAPQIAPTQ